MRDGPKISFNHLVVLSIPDGLSPEPFFPFPCRRTGHCPSVRMSKHLTGSERWFRQVEIIELVDQVQLLTVAFQSGKCCCRRQWRNGWLGKLSPADVALHIDKSSCCRLLWNLLNRLDDSTHEFFPPLSSLVCPRCGCGTRRRMAFFSRHESVKSVLEKKGENRQRKSSEFELNPLELMT